MIQFWWKTILNLFLFLKQFLKLISVQTKQKRRLYLFLVFVICAESCNNSLFLLLYYPPPPLLLWQPISSVCLFIFGVSLCLSVCLVMLWFVSIVPLRLSVCLVMFWYVSVCLLCLSLFCLWKCLYNLSLSLYLFVLILHFFL